MNESRAAELAERIVNATNGWTDAAVMELVREVATWRDPWCAAAAVDAIARGWTDPRRPPLAVIIKAYNEALDHKRRQELLAAPPPERPEDVCSPARGLVIARQAYIDEVERNARRPIGHPDKVLRSDELDLEFFDRVIARAVGRPQ